MYAIGWGTIWGGGGGKSPGKSRGVGPAGWVASPCHLPAWRLAWPGVSLPSGPRRPGLPVLARAGLPWHGCLVRGLVEGWAIEGWLSWPSCLGLAALAVLSCPVLSCAVLAVLGLGFLEEKNYFWLWGGGRGRR